MTTGAQIVRNFLSALRASGLTVAPSGISQNVWRVTGSVDSRHLDCLLYVKGRAEAPYRWGVTANVIGRLKGQSRPWKTVLLYERKDTGYLLSSVDTLYCANSVWPLGADGDYKPAAGSYLSRAATFGSINAILALL